MSLTANPENALLSLNTDASFRWHAPKTLPPASVDCRRPPPRAVLPSRALRRRLPLAIERARESLAARQHGHTRGLAGEAFECRFRDGLAVRERREPDLPEAEVRALQ